MDKILIVEDDNLLAKVYAEVLAKEGYQVSTATTGAMGLELAKKEKPDIVLLDVMIPGGMNGFDVLEQIRRTQDIRNTPVLIISNLDSEKNTAMQIGATDYVFKASTSIDELVDKVKKYISKDAVQPVSTS